MAEGRYVLIFALLSLYVAYSELKHFHSFAGPFKVIIRRGEKCPPELESKEKVTYYFRDVRTKYTQQPTYSGNATFPFFLNNSIGAAVRIASWSNMGGWKENAHILHFNSLCKNVHLIPSIYNEWSKGIYGEVVDCNYYPGYIRFENYTPSFSDLAIKQFFYGRWRADVQMLYSNGDVAACEPLKVIIRRLEKSPPEMEAKEKLPFYYRDIRTHYKQEPTYTGNATMLSNIFL